MPSILIVEDDSNVILELRERFREMNYEVVDTAVSGLEAVEKTNIHRPDLIIMDIRLKGEMDGIDAASVIRADYNLPIVYLTAHSDENNLSRAKLTEPFGYIIKPFEERELLTTIEMALYKHSMEKKLKESEHWLNAVLQSIGDALIATDSGKMLEMMIEAGNRLLSTLDSILEYSNFESKKSSVILKEISVADLENNLRHQFKATTKQKGLKFHIDLRKNNLKILADEKLLWKSAV